MIIHRLFNIPQKKFLFLMLLDLILKPFLCSRGIKAKPGYIYMYKVLVFTVVKLIYIVTSSVLEK